METRSERYAKYRGDIASMASDDFPKGKEAGAGSVAPSVPAAGGFDETTAKANSAYLRRRRNEWLLKGIIGMLLLAGLLVWAYFLFWRG